MTDMISLCSPGPTLGLAHVDSVSYGTFPRFDERQALAPMVLFCQGIREALRSTLRQPVAASTSWISCK